MDATRIDQLIAGSLLLTLLALSLAAFPEWQKLWRSTPRWAKLGVFLAALVALGLRLLLVEPALVHGDFQGSLVVEGVLEFPLPSGNHAGTYGADYGQGSFVLLGLLVSLLGRTAENVLRGNVLISALTTFPLAFLAARWAGRTSAGVYAAAAWSTSPLVARLAHSEDSHIVGLFFALIALSWAELTVIAERKKLALSGTVVAILLVYWTRQTYYVIGPMALGLIFERRTSLPKRWLLLAGALLSAALGFRFLRTLGTSNVYGWIALEMLRQPAMALGVFIDHPFFAVTRLSPLVATLGLFGVVLLARRSLSFALGFAVLFLLTLPSGLPPEGISWSFRLPVYALALIGVGAGAAFIDERRPLAGALFLALIGLIGRATLDNRRPDAQFVEYRYLRDTLAPLPRPLTLIHSHGESRFPCFAVAARLGIGLADITRLPNEAAGTWVVLEGLSAHAYTLAELRGIRDRGPPGMMPETIRAFFVSIFDRRTGYGMASTPRPSELRPEFRALLAHTTQLGPDGPKVHAADSLPDGIFDVPEFILRMHQWSAAKTTAPSKMAE